VREVVKRDSHRVHSYQQLFDRPAFRVPCIFEGTLLEVKAAAESVSAAIATGSLYSRRGELLAKIPARTEFETDSCRQMLDEIRNLVSGLNRTINELIDLLDDAEGKRANQSPKKFFRHMEFLLCDLIGLGVSHAFVQRAFALMDRIDAERNTVIDRANKLFAVAGFPAMPRIIASTEQLRVSAELDRVAGGPSYAWDHFYLRCHVELNAFLTTGRRS